MLLGKITLEEIRQNMSEALDKAFDEPTEKTRGTRQRSAGLEQDARQPRLAMEVGVTSNKKTRTRIENVAADRVKSGDNSSAQIDPDTMCLASFGDDSTGPPALPCFRNDALVDKGAVAPKPCLSPVEIRTLTAAGGLLPPVQPLQR